MEGTILPGRGRRIFADLPGFGRAPHSVFKRRLKNSKATINVLIANGMKLSPGPMRSIISLNNLTWFSAMLNSC